MAVGRHAAPGEQRRHTEPTEPIELALAALVSSQIATYRCPAAALGIPLELFRDRLNRPQ